MFVTVFVHEHAYAICMRMNLCMSTKCYEEQDPRISMSHSVESDVCFGYLSFFNVYFNKCAMSILLNDLKPKQHSVHMGSIPDCLQRN